MILVKIYDDNLVMLTSHDAVFYMCDANVKKTDPN